MRAVKSVVRRSCALALLAALTSVLAVGCGDDSGESAADGGGSSARGDLLAKLRKDGTIRIAISNEPPLTKVNADGTVEGIMVDPVREVMKRLGVENLTPTVTTFDAMIPGLQANQWDLIAGGMFMNDDRCEQVVFSVPIVVARPAFAVKPGNALGIDSYEWFTSHSDNKLAVLAGSFEENFAVKTVKIPDGQTMVVPDLQTGIEAVLAGRADALAAQDLSLGGASNKDRFELVLTSDGPLAGAGQAFRPGDKALRDEFDRVFDELVQDGTYAKIAKKYGVDAKVAPNTTRTDLAKGCES